MVWGKAAAGDSENGGRPLREVSRAVRAWGRPVGGANLDRGGMIPPAVLPGRVATVRPRRSTAFGLKESCSSWWNRAVLSRSCAAGGRDGLGRRSGRQANGVVGVRASGADESQLISPLSRCAIRACVRRRERISARAVPVGMLQGGRCECSRDSV